MLEISTKQHNRCDVIRPKGRIDSSSAPQFEKALKDVTDIGRYHIILNLAELNFMSSAGLRHLIAAQKTCKSLNRGMVVLAEVPDKIKEVLDLAGLTDLFIFYDTEVDAVGSF